ncbi:MAG: ATP-binding sensor histidine kinase [Spirochaetota bacterium]
MQTILNYEIEKEVYKSSNSLVYLAKEKDKNKKYILKYFHKEFPTPEGLTRFKREFIITQNIQGDGIIEAYHLLNYQNSLLMVLEDFGGESVANFLIDGKLEVEQFLPISISISESLGGIHQKQIIHKDVNPGNIIWNPLSGKVKFIDFGISSELLYETTNIQNLQVLEGTLNYMSPEQTGRMNRTMDYRTDLYSLGASFYHMLTGQVPFTSKDAMELVHCHITKQPIPPKELNPEIPEVLSDIILKLMAKMAEDRYQSAFGLSIDLHQCLEKYRKDSGEVKKFVLGENDLPDRLEIPQKLYGREEEVKILLDSFERVGYKQKEIIFISGYSGIGKTSLVQEIYKPILQRRGIFIRGKFDQFKRSIPYSSFIQAFQELIGYTLTESKKELSILKENILAALGIDAQVIIDVIPELELIIGKQPPAREISFEDSKSRFNLLFRSFVRVFTLRQYPLVIFLDDLQWADLPSLHLLEIIMTDRNINNLLVIGAYRDNEVSKTHPLLVTMKEINSKSLKVNLLSLRSLQLSQVSQLVEDTLAHSKSETNILSELCFDKTQGNPFFLNQFLKMLYQEKLLQIDFQKKQWQWDIQEIRKQNITDNVVDLMTKKIQRLLETTRYILQLAACIGNKFDLKTLAIVNEKGLDETALELWEALKKGFLVPISENYNLVGKNSANTVQEKWIAISESDTIIPEYRFLHDRVQQAAYLQIAEEQKKRVHLKVGMLLLEKYKENNKEEELFDIVNHLNLGMELIIEEDAILNLIELNLSVSFKAKLSAAYAPAYNYSEKALRLLQRFGPSKNSHLYMKAHLEAAETAYLSGSFENTTILLKSILNKDITLIGRAKAYRIKILALIAQHDSLGAIEAALEILDFLGIELTVYPSQEEIGQELEKTIKLLSQVSTADLLDLPLMDEQEKTIAMEIMESIYSASYQVSPSLFPLLIFKMIDLSLRFGNERTSALAYSCYGLILCGIVGDIDSGYQFGQLALKLIDKLKVEEHRPNAIFNVTVFITHWKEPLSNTMKPFFDSYQGGILVGDFEFASWAGLFYNINSYFSGVGLAKVAEETKKFTQAIQELKQETAFNYISMFLQTLTNLIEQNPTPWIIKGTIYDEFEMLVVHEKANDNNALFYLYFHKLSLSFLLEEYSIAFELLSATEKYLAGVPSTHFTVVFHFYDSLVQLLHFPSCEPNVQDTILEKISANQKKMQAWAEHCPENCLHKYYLVEAERAKIAGEDAKAIDNYTLATKYAKQSGFLHDEALSYELFAGFWRKKGNVELTQMVLSKSYHLYVLWGAGAKILHMEKEYGHILINRNLNSTGVSLQTGTTLSSLERNSNTLDLVSVMKASQSISQEIAIEQLFKNMIQIVIENAGAQKGFLLQEKEGNWMIEAQGELSDDKVTVLSSGAMQERENLQFPISIIQYVAITREPVVLEDAISDSKYMSDPYIVHNKTRSVLSLPVLHHGNLLGILYLENNSISRVFTSERLEILQLLSSQIAISLENAKLYSNLEEKVHERTRELKDAHKKILSLEREKTEKQLAGGFAHEMRNAMVGPKLIIQHLLGNEEGELRESINIINNEKLKEIYLLIKDQVSEPVLKSSLEHMKVIFENEEEIESSLKMIRKAVHRSLSITQLIMEYSKVGNEQVGKAKIDLNQVLQGVVSECRQVIFDNSIEVFLDLTEKNCEILGLETHFESIFKNIVLNAKDALLEISSNRKIEIMSQIIDNKYQIDFNEIGSGISPENMNKIYDAFFSTKPDSGTGLGLGVVKKIVSLYNGKINVESELEKGTKFTVVLPLNQE